MTRNCLMAAVYVALAGPLALAGEMTLHVFEKVIVTEEFLCEGANYGDFNKDGKGDIVAGPYWFEGPDFKTRHPYRPGKAFDKNGYSDNFLTFVYDFNGDGYPDILVYGFPGTPADWYENPKGKDGLWVKHRIFDTVDNESPDFGDVNGDGKPEIVCNFGGQMGYAEADWTDPAKPWKAHPISPKGGWHKYSHGLGYGDINGDGKTDLLEENAWWEQPADIGQLWIKHPEKFSAGLPNGSKGGAQMLVYDVDGDGKNDVITTLSAHEWGLSWFQQVREGNEIKFKPHLVMGNKPEQNKYGVKFSQMHALALVDMDGDGVKDLVIGKRHWAHGPKGDPEPQAPAVLYWLRIVRGKEDVDFVPYLVDSDSGVGTQVVAGDVNGDKLPDIVVGNKRGVFVFIHKMKQVSPEEWEKAQPKPLAPAAK